MDDTKAGGISMLREMLLGRRSKRLSGLGKEAPKGEVHVLALHPADGSTEGDLAHDSDLDPASPLDGEADDEAPKKEHPLAKLVMKHLDRLVPPRK